MLQTVERNPFITGTYSDRPYFIIILEAGGGLNMLPPYVARPRNSYINV